ncbi:MAG: zinc ribbon domain-containing protein [Deltaproteobacteria bacterium]|nr:zinc ribbon domain-containing protein [Deltaproteobacteria bacterium]
MTNVPQDHNLQGYTLRNAPSLKAVAMPTYEYACTSCGHEWEQEQRIVEPPIENCPSCQKKSAKRLVSSGNFILKGGGWYADLYSKPSKKAEKSEASASSSGSSGGSSSASPTPTSSTGSSSSGSSDTTSKPESKAPASSSATPSAS